MEYFLVVPVLMDRLTNRMGSEPILTIHVNFKRTSRLNIFPLITGIDTDELDSHVENFEEETIEFLIKVEETILDNE